MAMFNNCRYLLYTIYGRYRHYWPIAYFAGQVVQEKVGRGYSVLV